MWPSTVTESARSSPTTSGAVRGQRRKKAPKAASTWSHSPCSAQRSAIATSGSAAPVFGDPAWAITTAGTDAVRAVVPDRRLERPGVETVVAVDRDAPHAVGTEPERAEGLDVREVQLGRA